MDIGEIYQSIKLNDMMGVKIKLNNVYGYGTRAIAKVVGYGKPTMKNIKKDYPLGMELHFNIEQIENMERII